MSAQATILQPRNVDRVFRRAITGAFLGSVTGLLLGALLGALSAILAKGGYVSLLTVIGAGIGAAAGGVSGGAIGAGVILRSSRLRLRLALVVGGLAGLAVASEVMSPAAGELGVSGVGLGYAWHVLRIYVLCLAAGALGATALSLLLDLLRARWEWLHRWDPRPESEPSD